MARVTVRGEEPYGNRWTAGYVIASGNLLADFRYNVAAESQGRLQVTRLYELTEDAGGRDFLSFLIARETMYQKQWLAAIEELEKDGLEMTPCPSTFPELMEKTEVSYQFWNQSAGVDSQQGRWTSGPSIDGRGRFQYLPQLESLFGEPQMAPAPPQVHGMGKQPCRRSPVSRSRKATAAASSRRFCPELRPAVVARNATTVSTGASGRSATRKRTRDVGGSRASCL